jgi:SagB-type dehydrogenase family enzyme
MVMTARLYHQAVAYTRGRISGLGLDWSNQPTTFKSYDGLEHVSLSRQADLPELSLWQALSRAEWGKDLSSEALSAVLFHAAGLTRANAHKGDQFFYRACPSAGALYPCEVYLAWPGLNDLKPGLYHYDVGRHGLTLLRDGFPLPQDLGLPERSALPGEAIFFVTAIFFRTAWKYRARAYRYLNLDAGHLAEGLALGLSAYGTSYRMELDFDDAALANLLGVDPAREGCLTAIRFSAGKVRVSPCIPGPLPEMAGSLSRCAVLDDSPPEVLTVHDICSVVPGKESTPPSPEKSRLCSGLLWRDLPRLPGPPVQLSLFEAMSARRSRRNFIPGAMPTGTMTKVLSCLRGPLYPPGPHPAEDTCAVGVLTGIEMQSQPGFAMFDRHGQRLGLRRDGNMRPAMAGICLDQIWMREAAMHVLFLTDFAEVEPHLGNRGYRASLQAAGRLGHRLWLAAESLGLGACGVGAFLDGEAAELLGLPEGVGLTYVMTVGQARRKR